MNNILVENPNWENIRDIVYSICFDEQLKKCKNCGKELKYSKGLYHNYCSYKCSTSSKEVQEKYKRTNLEKYGTKHPVQCKKIQEKTKQTNLERLGCEYTFQSKEVQEKANQTCLERFGYKCSFQNKEIKEKIKQTNLERLGCEYPMQSKEVQKKAKQTNLDKYGTIYPYQNKEVQEKYKHTCIEIYGCENPMQNKEVQKKLKCTNKERYNIDYFVQSKEFKRNKLDNSYDNLIPKFIEYGITPDFPKEEYTGWDKTYRWKCKCGNIFEQKIYKTEHVEECPYLPHCWKCYPRLSGESKSELELFDFVKELAPNVRQHDRTIINPKELDIVIDELKLAIEFNGDYWHSTEFYLEHHNNLDGYYGCHLNKVLEANKKGYRLIHISESEWINNKEKIKDKIKNIYQNKENLTFIEDVIKLDRSWYNNVEIPGYKLVEELPPEIVNRNGYKVENCGYLIYERYY